MLRLAPALTILAMLGAGCVARPLALPAGPGTPAPDYAQPLAQALAPCRDVRTLGAELNLSGRAGRQRLRGRVLAGFAPEALRLEAVSPFGSPAFILVADGARGTLLLLRDKRVLQDAPPADILSALIGVPLGPGDLRALLSGCVKADAEKATGARAFGPDWMAVDLASGGTLYLQRQPTGWRVVAGRYSGLEIEYLRFTGALPEQIQIRSSPDVGTAEVNLTVRLSQVDVNGDLPRERLVAVNVPPGLSPLTLEELRTAGPLGQ
jgi:hypothetical protein